MEDTTYKMLEQQEFWEKLNPELSINTNVFKKPVSDIFDDINNDFLHDDSCLDKASQTLNDEGYFKLDSIIPPNITDPLKKGIENLTNLGILPVFSMVYDEYWLVLKRLNSILTQILGKQWYALPDIWGWHIKKGIDFSGWAAHRDLNDLYVDDKGRPTFVSLWIPLTKATPLNSCIYVLPIHLDPFYPDHLREFPSKPENCYNFSFENIRALPAEPGSILSWNVNTVHWGSRSTKHAEEERISIAFYLRRGSEKPENYIMFDKPFLFKDRLRMICENIFRYKKRNKLKPFVIKFAQQYADPNKEWDWE